MNGTTTIDSDFGALTWDAERSRWHGAIVLSASASCELLISAPPRYAEISDAARSAFAHIRTADDTTRQHASDRLLVTHNRAWNDGDPIDAATFKRRMIPHSITIEDDGSATIAFRDDNLFWGHYILLHISPEKEFFLAELYG